MNKRSIVRTLGQVSTAACIVMLLGNQLAYAHKPPGHEAKIVGVWDVRVNITNCNPNGTPGNVIFASFNAMNVFEADGTFLDTNSQNPVTTSSHFGYWRHIRGNKYEFAQRFFLFDTAGMSVGWRIVRHDVELTKSGLSFASFGTSETYDNDGILIGTGCSTSTAIRFR